MEIEENVYEKTRNEHLEKENLNLEIENYQK